MAFRGWVKGNASCNFASDKHSINSSVKYPNAFMSSSGTCNASRTAFREAVPYHDALTSVFHYGCSVLAETLLSPGRNYCQLVLFFVLSTQLRVYILCQKSAEAFLCFFFCLFVYEQRSLHGVQNEDVCGSVLYLLFSM